MALSPVILRGSDRTVSGTCATTATRIEVHAARALIVVGTTGVRVQVYGRDEASVPATGDAAPSGYLGFTAGDSYEMPSPQPGIQPWWLVIWGAAGGESVTVQALP